jgi:putative addiction module component (TIGR02574 family)
MSLPEDERARLATMLQDSLGDGSTQAEVDAAILKEVQRRLDDFDNGRTSTVSHGTVSAKLRAAVERARTLQSQPG